MKTYIALGSNLGDRRANLERAAERLRTLCPSLLASPVFQTPALVPEGAPSEWRIPYLNAIVEMEGELSATELLNSLKAFERGLGREDSPRWAPRLIDLDVLLIGDQVVNDSALRVPHAEMWNRSFVLDPLKHLAPDFKIPGQTRTVLHRARELKSASPLWMGVFNLTPDSFSDGGRFQQQEELGKNIFDFIENGGHIVDLGAESTRPGAQTLTPEQEWSRLQPALDLVKASFASEKFFKPKLSIDTYHAKTARLALENYPVSIINDVAGFRDSEMIDVLRNSNCEYVLMHSLTVPADPKKTLAKDLDPIAALREWLLGKIDILSNAGVNPNRILFDPGIGFGKTAHQSLIILQRIEELFDLPVRILVGHSRKSFMTLWNNRKASERDPESIGVSMSLAQRGVDILRVHEPTTHLRAYHALQEVQA